MSVYDEDGKRLEVFAASLTRRGQVLFSQRPPLLGSRLLLPLQGRVLLVLPFLLPVWSWFPLGPGSWPVPGGPATHCQAPSLGQG